MDDARERRLETFGRCGFATAMVGFGVLQIVYGDILIGRAPAWPAWWPGRVEVASVAGVGLIAAGASIATRIGRVSAAWALFGLLAAWALARNIAAALLATNAIVLTAVGKALVLASGALLFATPNDEVKGRSFSRIAASCLGAFFVFSGVMHFQFTAFVIQLIPEWIPARPFWALFTGVALFAGGVGMQVPFVARLATLCSGAMVFSWVLLLHVPRAVIVSTDAARRNEWTAVFEALVFASIAFVIAARLEKRTLSPSGSS